MKKQAIVTMGMPGSGKSTVMKREFDLSNYVVVDPDECKKLIPGYDPKNPGAVHMQSKRMAEAIKAQAIAEGKNVVIDGTGKNPAGMSMRIRELKANGYEVTLLYVRVRLETSLERNAKRERSVPEEIIYECYETIAESFEMVSGLADNVKVVNND